MASVVTIPKLRPLAEDFLGRPYAAQECWRLVHELLQMGGFCDAASTRNEVIGQVAEIWWVDDPRDPLSLVQPWDWYLLAPRGVPVADAAVGHIGLVIDAKDFVHARDKVGVCIEPLARWRRRLLQVARLRCLL
jgi:hypothetical protein